MSVARAAGVALTGNESSYNCAGVNAAGLSTYSMSPDEETNTRGSCDCVWLIVVSRARTLLPSSTHSAASCVFAMVTLLSAATELRASTPIAFVSRNVPPERMPAAVKLCTLLRKRHTQRGEGSYAIASDKYPL